MTADWEVKDLHVSVSLAEAKDQLREQLMAGEAVTCPCCEQLAKIYRRKINSTMARTLISMNRAGARDEYVHTPSLRGDTHEASQLSWWSLVEELPERREDGGKAGWWKLTDRGQNFVLGLASVPMYAHVYDGRVLHHSGQQVTIQHCLTDKFDYNELMFG